jgi:hypothetical protein
LGIGINVRFTPEKRTWFSTLVMSALCQKQTLCSAAVEPAPSALAVTGNVDYGVDDDTGRDGDQVRYEIEVDA